MKAQYITGIKRKDFVRLFDGISAFGCSQTLDEAREIQKRIKKTKIYKLIEVKK